MNNVRGTESNIEKCAEILAHSELGRNYFSAFTAVKEAAASDHFYMAMEGQECLAKSTSAHKNENTILRNIPLVIFGQVG